MLMTETKASKIHKIPLWQTSVQGREIPLFHSEAFEATGSDRPLLWLGGVHGDEPEGVHLCHFFLNYLHTNPGDFNSRIPWAMIPCLNPDGLQKLERLNANGVDLNRNYPAKDWSAEFTKAKYFPGDKPASEPESSALVKLIEKIDPFLIVHCHAYEPSFTYTGEPAKIYCQWLNKNIGYEIQPDIGYPTPGSLGQYAWLNHEIPVICIEVEEGLPKEKIEPLFEHGLINFCNQLLTTLK